MVKRELLEKLRCPECGSIELVLGPKVQEENGEIETAVINCAGCGRKYPVEYRIPRMMPDRFRDEKK